MKNNNYTKEERLVILEEVVNVEIKDDKDIKRLTSGSLNDTKREVIKRIQARGSKRTEGALVCQISQCACDLYKDDDIWSKKYYTELINELL